MTQTTRIELSLSSSKEKFNLLLRKHNLSHTLEPSKQISHQSLFMSPVGEDLIEVYATCLKVGAEDNLAVACNSTLRRLEEGITGLREKLITNNIFLLQDFVIIDTLESHSGHMASEEHISNTELRNTELLAELPFYYEEASE